MLLNWFHRLLLSLLNVTTGKFNITSMACTCGSFHIFIGQGWSKTRLFHVVQVGDDLGWHSGYGPGGPLLCLSSFSPACYLPNLRALVLQMRQFPQKTSRELPSLRGTSHSPVAVRFQGHWAQRLPGAKPWEAQRRMSAEVRRADSSIKGAKPKRSERFKRFSNLSFWS